MEIAMPVKVSKRDKTGSIAARRLRRKGLVPANVYGHKQEPQAIVIREDVVRMILSTGIRVIDISIDGAVETAMLKDLQWDCFGVDILHVDLYRVDSDETVTLGVPVVLRGTAEGAMEADAVLDQVLYTFTIECSAKNIPHDIPIKISGLKLGDAITVADVEFPEGIVCLNSPEAVVVQVTHAVEMPEVEEVEEGMGPVEPEVIGRAKAEEDAED